MARTKADKIALLDETAAFYSQKNLSFEFVLTSFIGPVCPRSRFYIEGKPGCAIGRLIRDKEECKWLNNCIPGDVRHNTVFINLPIYLREYGKQFLREIQTLHDHWNYWNENGISQKGKDRISTLKQLIEHDML